MLKECDIVKWIYEIKATGKKVFTNCYNRFSKTDTLWSGDCSKHSLFVIDNHNGVKHIWFYTISFQDLQFLLKNNLDNKQEYLIDIVSRDKRLYCDELKNAGFYVFTYMQRMSNSDISTVLNSNLPILDFEKEELGQTPELADAEIIKNKLWDIFDARISRLPNQSEVEKSIENGEFVICKNKENKIVSLLQKIVKPNSFYINQIYNGADKAVIHSILLKELRKYHKDGGKYVFAWVEENNIASQKFHKKYGMNHDGLWDVIFINKK